MATTLIDLDELVPDPKQAKLGGQVYTLPGDIPLETFLRINKAANAEGEVAQVEAFSELLIDLLATNVPEDDEATRTGLQRTIKKLGVKTVVQMLNKLYEDDLEDDEPIEANPTSPGTPSTSPSPTESDASSTSSDS